MNSGSVYYFDFTKLQSFDRLAEPSEKEEFRVISVSHTDKKKEGRQALQLYLNFTTDFRDQTSAIIYTETNNTKYTDIIDIDSFINDDVNYVFISPKENKETLREIFILTDETIQSVSVYHINVLNTTKGKVTQKVNSRALQELIFRRAYKNERPKEKKFNVYKAQAQKAPFDIFTIIGRGELIGLKKNDCLKEELPFSVRYLGEEFNLLSLDFSEEGKENGSDKSLSLSKGQAKCPVGAIGLINIGNTCYMNVILNCLLNATPFIKYFFNDQAKEGVSFGPLASTFEKILMMTSAYHEYESSAEYPSDLRNELSNLKEYLGQRYETFDNYQQHDAVEFLKIFLQGLSEEISRVKLIPTYTQLRFDPMNELQKESDKWFEVNMKREDSIVKDVFEGQLLIKYTCTGCTVEEHCFQPYRDLLLSFDHSNQKEWHDLTDMLSEFQNAENVSELSCKTCEQTGSFRMNMEIWRLPKILFITFKRFMLKNGEYQKVDIGVKFPVKSLDLSRLVKQSEHDSMKDAKYTLFGIVNHKGDLENGHYIAHCKNASDNQWREFNDIRVQKSNICQTDEYIYDSPYVLMYVKESCL